MNYYREHGLEMKIARIFNTCGPNLLPNDGRVVSTFIVQGLEGRALTVCGDCSQTRSFCYVTDYVTDLVDGLVRMMKSPDGCTGPINMGNPEERTIAKLADDVLRLTESNTKTVRKPLPEDDPARRRPDITRARQTLGWEAKVGYQAELQSTIEYFRACQH